MLHKSIPINYSSFFSKALTNIQNAFGLDGDLIESTCESVGREEGVGGRRPFTLSKETVGVSSAYFYTRLSGKNHLKLPF